MAANQALVDWGEVKANFELGQSSRQLGRAYGLSHTAVNKRARKEGWRRLREWLPVAKASSTARMLKNPTTKGERRIVTMGNRTPENMAQILADIECGSSRNIAARICGFAPSTLSQWLKDDPSFNEQIEAAEALSLKGDEASVVKARDRGDWKAGAYRLERHRFTKEDYAGPNQGGGGIHVTFNWSRDEAPMIDITPGKE